MSEVFIFPDRMEQQWRVFKTDMIGALTDLGCNRDTVDATARSLKPVFMKHARSDSCPVVPGNQEAAAYSVSAWVGRIVFGLIMEVALREAELISIHGERLP